VSTAWVAGTVRARAFGRRRLGRAGARALAAGPTLTDALSVLATTPYAHDVDFGDTLQEAQHAVGASLLWNVRVLAGWLPREGADAMRALAGWFEIANVDELLRGLAGAPAEPAYRLGALATAWPQLATATTLPDLRVVLARSAWGDPGGDSAWEVQLAMRLAWADRVAALAPPAAGWAGAGAALLVARETLGRHRRLPEALRPVAGRLLGADAAAAAGLGELAAVLVPTARWAMAGVTTSEDLWAAETRFWHRVEDDAFRLARTWQYGLRPVVGAVALMAVDAWRVRAALELAGRGGTGREVLDAVV
jgi:hypothetical protein